MNYYIIELLIQAWSTHSSSLQTDVFSFIIQIEHRIRYITLIQG